MAAISSFWPSSRIIGQNVFKLFRFPWRFLTSCAMFKAVVEESLLAYCNMLPRKTSFQTRSQWLFFNQSKLPTGWMLRVLERTMGCWAREELLLQCNIHYHRHTQGIRPCHFHDRRMIYRLCMRIVHTRHGHSHPQCPSSYYCFHLLFDLLLNDSVLLGNLGDCQHTYANSLHCSRGSNQCYLSTSDRIPSKLCSISPRSLHNHRNASLHKRNE